MKKIKGSRNTIIIFILIVFISILAIFLQWSRKSGDMVVVSVDGQVIRTVSLQENISFRVDTDWGYNQIEISDGKVSVSEADCQNQICVQKHSIDKKGQIIACIPHKLVVSIEGRESEVDAVAY